jgi:YD repeat-containing protein
MRILFAIAAFFVCTNSLFSQLPEFKHLTDFERVLTPSPSAAALGNFGGMELRKSSGGISKNIPLFEIPQRGFVYSPSINYFSNGIKVDDWGSRVGIGWTENLTAVITRIVKSVPDEKATSRINSATEFGPPGAPEQTQASYDKIYSLARRDTRVDGEYDLFSYNLFGLSGQFIIHNGTAVLLNKEQNVKIVIDEISPTYKFTLTTADGIIYTFNSQTEGTKYNTENACESETPSSLGYITTAWFVDEISSLTGDMHISFGYDNITYTHFYDFTQFFTLNFPAYSNGYCSPGEFPLQAFNNGCFRKKDVNTRVLRTVQGTNFTIQYDYTNREDIVNEQLLEFATVTYADGQTRRIEFRYDKYTATTNFEGGLATHFGGVEPEAPGLKVRYFLNAAKVIDGDDNLVQQYKMSYLNPAVLPHRFSFSQDMFGCYNGKANESMVPGGVGGPIDQTKYPAVYAYANRESNSNGMAGLLNKIEYPTGGSDTIVYEGNTFGEKPVPPPPPPPFEPWYIWDYMSTYDEQSYIGAFFDIFPPFKMHARLTVKYFAEEGAETGTEVEQYATVTLASSDGPIGSTRAEYRIGDVKTFDVVLDPTKEYALRTDIWGKHTVVWASVEALDRIVETPPVVSDAYMGYRVKSVTSNPVIGKKITKLYNYNTFSKTGTRELTFSNTSSLVKPPAHDYYSLGLGKCFYQLTSYPYNTLYQFFHIGRFDKNPNYSPYVFNGIPFTYSMITEFTDSDAGTFTAEEYQATSNTYSGIIMGGSVGFPSYQVTPVSPAVENSAWEQGLLKKRLIGGKTGSSYLINQEETWNRSETSDLFYNYAASVLTDLTQVALSNPIDLIRHHQLIGHKTYSHWVKLDNKETIVYSSGNSNDALITKQSYKYNSDDKMVEEEETFGSDGKKVNRTIYRPAKMISLGLDNNGVYASMKLDNLIAPEIVSKRSVNGVQVGLEQLNYTHPSLYYLPASIQTQLRVTDPLKTRALFNKHDSYGNVLEKQLANNVKEVYLWGYGGIHPVAHIVGMSYDEVQAAANVDYDLLNGYSNIIESELLRIRNALASYPFVQIWTYTYTYRPLVRMLSETDPAGKIFYYEYDAFDRLSLVKDKDGNILKRYDYKYAGQ